MKLRKYSKFILPTIAVFGLLIGSQLRLQKAAALSGSQFSAANIIDYGVFFNPSSMNAGDVQNFLTAKVPVCDSNGTQPSGHTGYTRAQWGAANGYPAPYTCLKDYSQDVPSTSPDAYCNGGISGAHKTAAQIIFDVSQACGISPKVLIVLLQKEQSLVTDDWPWSIQYQSATGYGCPDTAACDSQYYGFFNQVYNAAHQFQRYTKQPQNFNFAAGRTSNIQYNPNGGCGSSAVGVQNSSTAALYNYTPYQPNAAALANLYGTGDGCSAYGNRNFWRLFNDWFGSTQTNTPYAWQLSSFQIYSDPARTTAFSVDTTVAPGASVYMRVKAINVGNQTWDRSSLRLGTFRPMQRASQFYDSGTWLNAARPAQMTEASVAPGDTGTFDFVMKAPSTTGTYQEYLNLVAENIAWLNDLGTSVIINVVSPAAPNNANSNILSSGAVLHPQDLLLSPDGQSTLALQDDGNLVLYSNFKAAWNSVTFGKTPDRLVMGTDGNLVIYFKDGSTWSTGTQGHPGAYLKLQTDGNLVLYDTGNNALWNTVTFQTPDHLSYVNTTLHPGTMLQGQQLETADRHYRLTFQQDGNLVLYSNTTNRALWNSSTHSRGAKFATLQDDGNLVIYDGNHRAIWNTVTFGNGSSRLIIQQDGNLVLYNSANRPSWNTVTFNQP
jgi:hypothetical protein